MITSIAPFLAFTGQAAEAVAFYGSALPDTSVEVLNHYGAGEEGAEGTVRFAALSISGHRLRIIDVPPDPGFEMGAGLSIFLTCDAGADVDAFVTPLADGGAILMPPDPYPFADRFAWVADRFGVHWQIIFGHKLEPEAA